LGVVAALDGARVALIDSGSLSSLELIAISRSGKAVEVADAVAGGLGVARRDGTGSDNGGESENDGGERVSEHLELSA
jgi:hypothetical protein